MSKLTELQKQIVNHLKKLRNEVQFQEQCLYTDVWQEAVSEGAIVCSLDEYIEEVHNGNYPSLDGVEYGYGG